MNDKLGDIDVDGATFDAWTRLAVETAFRFFNGEFGRIAERDFVEIVGANVGGLGWLLVLFGNNSHSVFLRSGVL